MTACLNYHKRSLFLQYMLQTAYYRDRQTFFDYKTNIRKNPIPIYTKYLISQKRYKEGKSPGEAKDWLL